MADTVVRKTGEGVDKPDAEKALPIDINYKQLVEWLVGRQKLPGDWSKRLVAIQTKATECFKELPAEVIAKLKGGNDATLDYFRAVAIRDLLAETADRGLFGGLTGSAGIWDKIVKSYEKGGIFLGEAALAMIQNAEYEVPYLRKQATKLKHMCEDAERRQAEYTRSAATCAAAYKQECEQLGISPAGADVRKQLASLAADLPALYDEAMEALKQGTLGDAIKYYHSFSQYAHSVSSDASQLSVLVEVREGRTAPPATTTQLIASSTSTAAAGGGGGGIDWGISTAELSSAAAGGGGIDWGLSLEPTAAGADASAGGGGGGGGISWDLGDLGTGDGGGGGDAGGISWDVDAVQVQAEDAAAPVDVVWDIGDAAGGDADNTWVVDVTGGSDQPAAAGGIDWGIDLTEAAVEGAGGAGVGGQTAGGGAGGEAAGGDGSVAARRLVADAEYRASLVDDLLELRAFLIERRSELSSTGSQLLSSVMPEALQEVGSQAVSGMMAAVEAALGKLRSERLVQLLLLGSSQRYVDRLSSALQRKAGQEGRMQAAAKEAVIRGQEAKLQLKELSSKVAELVERTRSIKAHVETALSDMFQGRKVNVLGDINTVLATTLA